MTIKEIAKKAEVSVATVSNILNGKDKRYSEATRARVCAVIEEHQYMPSFTARALSRQQTKMIACVIRSMNMPYGIQIMAGAEAYCAENGYSLVICNANCSVDKVKTYLRGLKAKGVEGVILSYELVELREEILQLQSQGIQVITTQNSDIEGVYIVGMDNFLMMLQARRYMTRIGYKRVAYISQGVNTCNEKKLYEGFRQGSLEAGEDIGELVTYGGDSIEERLYQAMDQVDSKVYEALLTINTTFVETIHNYYSEKNIPQNKRKPIYVITPRDIAPEVLGVESHAIRFDVSGESVGGLAAKTLIGAIEGEKLPMRQSIMPKMIE